jgi:hypothetical protein
MEKWVSSARPSDIPGATHVNTPPHRPNIYTSLSGADRPVMRRLIAAGLLPERAGQRIIAGGRWPPRRWR